MTLLASDPGLPPPFRPIALREGADALRCASDLAPRHGAGTLCWVRAWGRAEAAVVLEPECPLAQARIALPIAATALVEALAAYGPPELPLGYRWPATFVVNGGACGALRLIAPPNARPAVVPDWIAVGYELRLAFPEPYEPGRDPSRTSLFEEGFHELTPAALVADWARHLMAGLDEWQNTGPRRVAERFLARLLDPPPEQGLRRGLDPATGALVLERDGQPPQRLAAA